MKLESLHNNNNSKTGRQQICVAILCEELRYTTENKHIIDTALALAKYGHKVVIFTNENHIRRGTNKLKRKLDIVTLGKFIPKSVFGYFKNTLLNIWSIYAALFTCLFKPKQNTNIIFCDGNIFALPILNLIGSFKIIQFHNLYNFTQLQNSETNKIKLAKSWIDFRSIKFVNEVLLPNKITCDLFEKNYKFNINKTVLYPCISTNYSDNYKSNIVIPKIPKKNIIPYLSCDNYIFVIFGDYSPISNFELAIDALAILVNKIRKHNVQKIHLVFAGQCNKKYKDQVRYCANLVTKTRKNNLMNNITFLNTVQMTTKRTLLENSVCLIHTSQCDIYNKSILEAMSYSKPIIATNSEFCMEILEHGITGYILPADPLRFAEIMHEIIYNPGFSKLIGQAAFEEYLKKYSFQKFARDVNKLVLKYNRNTCLELKKTGEIQSVIKTYYQNECRKFSIEGCK